jgi:hypothetical protein
LLVVSAHQVVCCVVQDVNPLYDAQMMKQTIFVERDKQKLPIHRFPAKLINNLGRKHVKLTNMHKLVRPHGFNIVMIIQRFRHSLTIMTNCVADESQ